MLSRTVAIVDADPAITDCMVEFLDTEGYPTVAWRGEDDPVAFIQRERPGVVILDVRLSDDHAGLVVLNQLRADPALHHLPVIVCTADHRFLQEHADELATLHADTLAKPFDLDDLKAKVDATITTR